MAGNVVSFPQKEIPEDDLTIEEMNLEQLKAYLAELRGMLDELDAHEPKNPDSEAYDKWAARHEAIEDTVDDVLDRLDELQ